MTILVCGSLAFDTIMDFEGRFADHILPDQIHILNVAFVVPTLRREYGGCAGNIAYGLRQLGAAVRPVATLGADGDGYLQRLRDLGVDTSAVRVLGHTYTAQAMIMTDRDNNQITAFHPGAMAEAHTNPISDTRGVRLAILAPDGKQATWEHAQQLRAAGVPFLFDPGQGLPLFDGAELRQLIEWADWAALNDYEARLLCERTGWTLAQVSQRVRALVVTLGEHGCEVWEGGTATRVPGERASAIVDPTGCGDAFRAALLYGLAAGWPVAQAAQLGNRMGATKIATLGGQNYRFSMTD